MAAAFSLQSARVTIQLTHENSNRTVSFEGEEAGAGYASPTLDLIAAGFLVLLTIIVMVASWMLPVPGDILTAPGLLPFFTAFSLLLMALVLGATALKRKRLSAKSTSSTEPVESLPTARTLLLAALVGLYILSLQMLAFQKDFSIGETFFSISAFEPVTIVALADIIHIHWRGPLWITTVISVLWTLVLSLIFQKAFNIPLPGSF